MRFVGRIRAIISSGIACFCLVGAPNGAHAEPLRGEMRADSTRLRVVTWNVWGVPMFADHWNQRVRRIVPALGEYNPDVVALQEVWTKRDGARLIKAFRRAGLPFARHYEGASQMGGLLIASRYPFEDRGFHPFGMGKATPIPWHLDWMADKGIAAVRIHTPGGPVDFVNTHFQAAYASGYLSVRLAQAVELARHTLSRDVPMIVAGDVNAHQEELPFRLLTAYADLSEALPGFGVDTVLLRNGSSAGWNVQKAERVFHLPVSLGSRIRKPLSDHDGLLVDLELSRAAVAQQARSSAPLMRSAVVEAILEEARQYAAAASTTHRVQMWTYRVGALFLSLFAVWVFATWRLRRGWLRWLAVSGMMASLWLSHMGFVYGPIHLRGVLAMADALDIDPSSTDPSSTEPSSIGAKLVSTRPELVEGQPDFDEDQNDNVPLDPQASVVLLEL